MTTPSDLAGKTARSAAGKIAMLESAARDQMHLAWKALNALDCETAATAAGQAACTLADLSAAFEDAVAVIREAEGIATASAPAEHHGQRNTRR